MITRLATIFRLVLPAKARKLALVAGAGILLGCPQNVGVWVAATGEAGTVVFALGRVGRATRVPEPIRMSGLIVYDCEERRTGLTGPLVVKWRVETSRDDLVDSIRYGVPPIGGKSIEGPTPLERGRCYRVELLGTSSSDFMLDASDVAYEVVRR